MLIVMWINYDLMGKLSAHSPEGKLSAHSPEGKLRDHSHVDKLFMFLWVS